MFQRKSFSCPPKIVDFSPKGNISYTYPKIINFSTEKRFYTQQQQKNDFLLY